MVEMVDREKALALLEGALDGELTGSGAEAIRHCWRLIRDMLVLPPLPHQGRPDTLDQFAWHVARDNELARLRAALERIAHGERGTPGLDPGPREIARASLATKEE